MSLRIPREELEYSDDDGIYCHNGAPAEGTVFRKDSTGRLINEQEYRAGLPWGPGRSWLPSGNLASESQWNAGVFHGLQRKWAENGSLILEEFDEFGVCLWRKRWNEVGNSIEGYMLRRIDPNYRTLAMMRTQYPDEVLRPDLPGE